MFDTTLPVDQVKELVALIREGNLKENVPQALKLGFWILGSTLETFYPAQQEDDVEALEQCDLDGCCRNVLDRSAPFLSSEVVSAQALSPELLLAIYELVMMLLEKK